MPIGIVLSVVCVAVFHCLNGPFVAHLYHDVVPLLQYFPLFFAGIVFYKIHTGSGRQVGKYAVVLLCLLCQVLLYKAAGRSAFHISHGRYAGMLTIYFALFVLFVHGRLAFIVSKPFLFLGKISYSLYLSHMFVSLSIIIPFLTERLHIGRITASLFIAFPIAILLAAFINRYIEIPLSRRMKEGLRSRLMRVGPDV